MTEVYVAIASAIVGGAIAWGAMRESLRSLRKDLNGMGCKVRDYNAKTDKCLTNLKGALLATCADDKRIHVATLLKD